MSGGMDFVLVQLLGLSNALQHQNQGAPHRSDVDGLISGVEDEDRLLHQRSTPGSHEMGGSDTIISGRHSLPGG